MTDFLITEADVGKKFRLRGGGIVTVTRVSCDLVDTDRTGRSHYKNGRASLHEEKAYDIVEKLPECADCKDTGLNPVEGMPDRMCMCFIGTAKNLLEEDTRAKSLSDLARLDNALLDTPPHHFSSDPKIAFSDTPTMTASDGKKYPMELFGVQQRFDEVMPPFGVDLKVYSRIPKFITGYVYCLKHDNGHLLYRDNHSDDWVSSNADIEDLTWTLAPSPAVEKVEPQIWEPFTRENHHRCKKYFIMTDGSDGSIELYIDEDDLVKASEKIDALYAWKNHVLSKDEAEL